MQLNPIEPTVVWLTWRQLFANRRLYLAALFSLAPLFVAVLFQTFAQNPVKDGQAFYLVLQREIVVGTLLPLAALVFGTNAFGGEIDDGTLIYLLVKPIARWRVVFSKYLVAALSTSVMMVPAVFLPWLLIRSADVPVGAPMAFLWGALAGSWLYAGVFVMLGFIPRYSLVLGLVYVVGFEGVLTRSIAGFKFLSIREFAATVSSAMADPALDFAKPFVPMSTVKTAGTIFLVGSLAISVWRLWRYEMAERL